MGEPAKMLLAVRVCDKLSVGEARDGPPVIISCRNNVKSTFPTDANGRQVSYIA